MRYATVIRIRRACQATSFAVFLYLLLRTDFHGSFSKGGDVELPEPVNLFFGLDPLAALVNALATGGLYRGLLWSRYRSGRRVDPRGCAGPYT